MPCRQKIKIKGVEVDSQLQPKILEIMKRSPHLVLSEVNSFIDEPLDSIDELRESHYEDVAGRMYNYFTDESFINEFGDWQNDDTLSHNKYSNGEPKLFLDKRNNKFYYRNKYNDKTYFPLHDNGLGFIYDVESIEEGVKYIAYKFFQSNFNGDYSNLSFIGEETTPETIRQIIMLKVNEFEGTDKQYLADDLRDSLFYLDEWTQRVKNYFDSLGFKVEDTDVDIQNEEENSTQQLVRKASFEQDSKNAVSANIKAFLSFLPNPDAVDFVFEESGFVEFEDIYNTLQNGLSDISPTIVDANVEDTFEIMLNRIGELAHRKPYLKELINILNHPSLTEEKKSEFTQAFSLVKNPFFVTEIDFEGREIKFTTKDVSNVNANFNVINREWGYNFEANFLDNKVLDKPKMRKVYDELRVVRSEFDQLRRTITDADQLEKTVNDLVNVLSDIGVETTEQAFNSYIGNLADVNIEIDSVLDKLNNIIATTDKFLIAVGKGEIRLYNQGRFTNPLNKESLFKELAKEEAFFKPDGSDASIFSAGKSFWVYSLPSHIAGELNKWKSNINELEDLYRSDNGSGSKILQYLLARDQRWVRESDRLEEAKKRIGNYKIGIFNALQNKKTDKISSDPKGNTELSKDDAIIDTINRALLSVKGTEKSLFNTPTPADKSTSYLLSHGYFANSNITQIQDGKPILSDNIVNIFYDYFASEYDRMNKAKVIIEDPNSRKTVYYHANKQGDTIKRGKVVGNAFKSQIFEGLSFENINKIFPEEGKLIYNENGTPALKSLDQFQGIIKDYIRNVLQDGVIDTMQKLTNNDIIVEDGDAKGGFVAPGLDVAIMSNYKNNYAFPVHNAISDFHINTMINNIEYSKLFSGDPAYYKNMVDYAKRIPATYTDGLQLRLLNNDELTFNAAIIQGVEVGSKYMNELKELVGEDIASWYGDGKINTTDAQAWITPKRWEFLMKRLGLWNSYHESAYPKMLGTDKTPFTAKELKAVAQPLKGVYFKINNGVPTYLKYSQAVLLPDLVRGTDMQRLYDAMVADPDNEIDEVITLDGIKVGAPIPDNIHTNEGFLKDDFTLTPLELDNRGWKMQQNLPTKTFKQTDVGSQIQKNALAGLAYNLDSDFIYGGETVKGIDLYRDINNIIGALSDKGLSNLSSELDIDASGKINNVDALYSLLLKEARKKNINDNLIQALEKEMSIYGIPQSNTKLMNMFFSIVKDRLVKIKTNGGSFIQVSNFGIDRLTDPQKAGIKWFIDPGKGLKPPHIEGDSKNLPTSQDSINIYAGANQNAHLSNFAVRPFVIGGEEYDSVEQYFQLQKFTDAAVLDYNTQEQADKVFEIANKIHASKSGATIKRLGGTRIPGVKLNEEYWNSQAPIVMKEAILESFKQNPDALESLLDTGDANLTHTQDRSKWGKLFPQILMEVREELKPLHAKEVGTEINLSSDYNFNPSNVSEDTRENYKQFVLDEIGQPEVIYDNNAIKFNYDGINITIRKDGSVVYDKLNQTIVDLSVKDPGYDIKFMIGLNKIAEELKDKSSLTKKVIKPGQILLPGSLIAKYIPNWKDIPADELKAMIDPRILENIVGYRIPNQGLSSNDALELVGILPEGMGDAVVAYAEIPTKTGSDFDIDKMYMMIPSFSKADNGTLVYDEINPELPLKDQSLGALQNKLIEAYQAIFLHPEVIKDVMTPIDFDYIKTDITTIFDDSGAKPDLYHFDAINQINLKYDFLAGKAGVGQTANMLVDHVRGMFMNTSLIGTYIGRGHKNDDEETLFDREFSEELSDRDAKYMSEKLSLPIDEVRSYKIGHSISAFLNAFVDIAKDPYVTRGNWTTQTSNTGFMMLRAGIHPFYVNRFIGQPIIKEYVDFVTNAESKFKNEAGNMRKLFLEYYSKKHDLPNEKPESIGLNHLSLQHLDSMIGSEGNNLDQLDVIYTFFQLQDYSKEVINSINASKPDVSGAGKDLSSRFIISNLVNELKSNSDKKVTGTLSNFRDKLLDPRTGEPTVLGHYIKNSIYWTNGILKNNPKLFLMANKSIEDTFNAVSKQMRGTKLLSQDIADELYKSYYSYVMSGFEGLETANSARTLFVELAKDVALARMEDQENFFLQQLEIVEEEGLNFIRMQNKKRSKNIQNKLYRGWRTLMDDMPELAEKLVKYSYYQSGFQNNISEFFSHIPHEYFVDTKLNQYIYEVNSDINGMQDQFIEQFYRHNWENNLIVPRIPKKQYRILEKDISYVRINELQQELPLFARIGGKLLKLQGYTEKGNGIYTVTYKLGTKKVNGNIFEYRYTAPRTRSQLGANNPDNLADINKYNDTLSLTPVGELNIDDKSLSNEHLELNEADKSFNEIFNENVENNNNPPDLSSPGIDEQLDKFNEFCD